MKTIRRVFVFVCLLGLASSAPMGLAAPNDAAFERIMSLEGHWEGKRSDGKHVKVSYQIHSNGSAVLETISPPDEPTMLTVYHMDGQDLMMTHYCAAQNQPRMKAKSASEKVVSFEFVDATNLAHSTDGHMHQLELTFIDNNHFLQKWTWMEKGETKDTTFDLARVN